MILPLKRRAGPTGKILPFMEGRTSNSLMLPGDKNKIRVLVLSRLYPNEINRAYGIFVHQQVKSLSENGCDVTVISPTPWAPKILWFRRKWRELGKISKSGRVDGIKAYYPKYLEFPGGWNYPWSGILVFLWIRRLVIPIRRLFPFDVIYSNTDVTDGHAAILLGNLFGVPSVCISRGELNISPYKSRFAMEACKRVIRNCDQVVAVSKALKGAAERLEIPKKDIQVVYSGCDVMTFRNMGKRRSVKKKIGLPIDALILMYVGSIERDKGLYELFHVFDVLSKRHAKLHLVMIGKGPDKLSLNALAREHGLARKILDPGPKRSF